jgi:hypothetical protein
MTIIQSLAPDRFSVARGARGRFPKESSGNPKGRPRGIPYRKPRLPDLADWRLTPVALSRLLDRKPHMLRPLAARILPPPRAPTDPAGRLGSDLSSLRTREDVHRVLCGMLAAVATGQIAPAEAARISRRLQARLAALDRAPRQDPSAAGVTGQAPLTGTGDSH